MRAPANGEEADCVGGSPPPHNCGASPNPRAGLEAVPLPLGLTQASWDPLKWVPGKSCPGAWIRGGVSGAGRGLSLGQSLGAPAPRRVAVGHLPSGFTAPFLLTLAPLCHPRVSEPSLPTLATSSSSPSKLSLDPPLPGSLP